MDWNEAIDLDRRKFTSRLVVERVLARGWKIAGFKTNPAIFLVYIPGREQPVKIFSASPPQMSYPASKIAKDKYITNQILNTHALPVPQELLVGINDASDEAEKFLDQYKQVVVKPLDASHGNGITTHIATKSQLIDAIGAAKAVTEKAVVLVQQQVQGVDIRVLCLDYKAINGISRISARVTGDGVHSVEELITIENDKPERGQNYKTKLNVIPLDDVKQFLGAKIAEVPAKNEEIQVIGVSNVGKGGERHNIWGDIPQFLLEMAETAAKALELPVCGVDFMVRRIPQMTDTVDDLEPYIIEANECPMLTMYDDLNSPKQHAVVDAYLDYIAKY